MKEIIILFIFASLVSCSNINTHSSRSISSETSIDLSSLSGYFHKVSIINGQKNQTDTVMNYYKNFKFYGESDSFQILSLDEFAIVKDVNGKLNLTELFTVLDPDNQYPIRSLNAKEIQNTISSQPEESKRLKFIVVDANHIVIEVSNKVCTFHKFDTCLWSNWIDNAEEVQLTRYIPGRDGTSPFLPIKETQFQEYLLKTSHSDNAMILDSKILDYFDKNAPDLNEQNRNGWSALHTVARFGNSEIVEEVVKRGASTQLKTEWGETPLMVAVINFFYLGEFSVLAHIDAIESLIRLDPTSLDIPDNKGNTPRSVLKEYLIGQKTNSKIKRLFSADTVKLIMKK